MKSHTQRVIQESIEFNWPWFYWIIGIARLLGISAIIVSGFAYLFNVDWWVKLLVSGVLSIVIAWIVKRIVEVVFWEMIKQQNN